MKKIWIACGIALGNFLFAEGMNLPEPLKYFSADMKRIMPSAGKFEACGNGIFSVLDVKGKKIGKLYLEHIPDEERKMGYAGTIEIAVLFNAEDEVAGILIGRNTAWRHACRNRGILLLRRTGQTAQRIGNSRS